MSKIDYTLLGGTVRRSHDAAIVLGDDLAETVAEAVVGAISTDIEVKLGDTTVFLAMLLDPEHWAEDWAEVGVDDVEEFLGDLISEGPS